MATMYLLRQMVLIDTVLSVKDGQAMLKFARYVRICGLVTVVDVFPRYIMVDVQSYSVNELAR